MLWVLSLASFDHGATKMIVREIDEELKRILNADRDAVFAVKNEQGDTIGALPRELVVDLLLTSKRKV